MLSIEIEKSLSLAFTFAEINISDDFKTDTIYEFSFDNEKRLIAVDNKIYFDSDYITLP